MARIDRRGKNHFRLIVKTPQGRRVKAVKVRDEKLLLSPEKLWQHLKNELVKFERE